jgi:MscS family membrane protein
VILTIGGLVWLGMLLAGWVERHIGRRLERRDPTGAVSILRFVRWAVDLVLFTAGLLFGLRHFGVDPTAALAGIGVGGVAVALAAQKTLENVIGGLSIIFDRTVRVGDFIGAGTTVGTVTSIGLRSTSLRTVDRTVVSVPNGQIANLTLENYSRRDKFKLQQTLSLHYGTTEEQVRRICEGVAKRLREDARVESDSARACLLRFGSSSLDVEVFAYCRARDWAHFLEIQDGLLLEFLDIVEKNGAKLALPAQTLYQAPDST